MTAQLYTPGQLPRLVSSAGFTIPDASGFAQVPLEAASMLGCALGLVDVLALGDGYVVYTVFDSEEDFNPKAMHVVAQLTGFSFNIEEEDELLCGPVLVVTA